MDDIRGSGHILAMARSIIGLSVVQVGEKPDPKGPRKLEVLKTNLCEIPPSLGLELVRISSGEKKNDGVSIKWGDVAQPFKEPSTKDSCREWLLDLMREYKEIKPRQVVQLAREAGFSQTMLYRVKEELDGQISTTAGKYDPATKWVLTEKDENEEIEDGAMDIT
jgi:hypothetical protein